MDVPGGHKDDPLLTYFGVQLRNLYGIEIVTKNLTDVLTIAMAVADAVAPGAIPVPVTEILVEGIVDLMNVARMITADLGRQRRTTGTLVTVIAEFVRAMEMDLLRRMERRNN